jgi:predicted AAA+ superfamily ATPase
VGKTWLVRDLAERRGLDLVELNFERDPGLRRHFESNDPAKIVGELSLVLNREIAIDRSLLFLDEIQAAGELLATLRWFREEMPDLAVIAAGSLLEFTLADHDFRMPVGRITYSHVEPLSFPEFLEGHGRSELLSVLSSWRPRKELSAAAHDSATDWFHRYSMVGGMPAVAAADVEGRSPAECRELQQELMATYRADFAKYSGRMDRNVLDSVLMTVTASVGSKFVYARVGEGVKHHQAKRGLELLAAARLCHLVRHTAANGLPLSSEASDKFRKAVLLDVGLLHGLLRTPAAGRFPEQKSLSSAIRSRVSDQLAAQQLRLREVGSGDGPELFYWQRKGGRPGVIDYLVQTHGRIVPIELKSGAAGSMKSLHQFMHDKGMNTAVRCDANPPSVMDVALKTTLGDRVRYRLVGIPAYLLWNLDAILEPVLDGNGSGQ